MIIDSLLFHAEQETITAEQTALHNKSKFWLNYYIHYFCKVTQELTTTKMQQQTHWHGHQ
jgi:hypothetical protein